MSVVVFRGYLERSVIINFFSGYLAHAVVYRLLPGLSERGPKPFTLRPLLFNGRPVLGKTIVEAGSQVELHVAFFEPNLAERFMETLNSGFELFGAKVEPISLSLWQVPRPIADALPVFRAEFLSPTRFETPPYVRRPVPVFDLTPRPLNIFKSAVKTAMRLGLVDVGRARRFLRWAYASVGVVDFGCGRRCTVAVRLAGGRRVRGFVGWAVYRAFETSMLGDMWRMLSIAEAFGVGSNRPLGFGAVRIAPVYGGASGAGRRV